MQITLGHVREIACVSGVWYSASQKYNVLGFDAFVTFSLVAISNSRAISHSSYNYIIRSACNVKAVIINMQYLDFFKKNRSGKTT